MQPELPGLGRLPVNFLACLGFLILGLGHPGFWLLGLALETAFLGMLVTNERFQNWVDAVENELRQGSNRDLRQTLLGQIDKECRARFALLERKCSDILQAYRNSGAEDYTLENNRTALDKLSFLYLKLLMSRTYLNATSDPDRARKLELKIQNLEKDLSDTSLSGSLRESKEATLNINRQLLDNCKKRDASMEEVESDLSRIEAQLDLALDHASLQGNNEVISGHIELASSLLDDSTYLDSNAMSEAMSRTYGNGQSQGAAKES